MSGPNGIIQLLANFLKFSEPKPVFLYQTAMWCSMPNLGDGVL